MSGKEALKQRQTGSEIPCRWLSCIGVYNENDLPSRFYAVDEIFSSSLAEKLPCQLRFILIPTAKKIYLSIKQLATDVCGNLNQFFQALADFFSSLKPDDKDDK